MLISIALGLVLIQAPPSAVTQELIQFEQALGGAWKKGDCAAWGALLAPEWSVTHIDAEVITKQEALEMCKTQAALLATLESDDFSVREFGDAAVVTGRTTATTKGPSPQTVTLRFSDFFVRRNGKWLVVASHATRIGS